MGVFTDLIDASDDATAAALRRVLDTVLAIVPDAVEDLSYGTPALRYRGSPLLGVRVAKAGISLFPFSPEVVAAWLRTWPDSRSPRARSGSPWRPRSRRRDPAPDGGTAARRDRGPATMSDPGMQFGWPPPQERTEIAARLGAAAAEMTTAALARIAEEHPWFAELDAEHRSWITLVARNGIDGFLEWFAAGGRSISPGAVFDAAPRALARRITLNQTVDLVRTTIDTVEHRIAELPEAEQGPLRVGILRYSREIAFAAAQVYARAAEARGAWDARLEALVVDAVIRGDADESVVSRASTLGWASPPGDRRGHRRRSGRPGGDRSKPSGSRRPGTPSTCSPRPRATAWCW